MSHTATTPSTTVSTSPQIETSDIRPVDLRITIGDECGFDFKSRVIKSDSNTLGAIYFTKSHLKSIARHLEIVSPPSTRLECYQQIRSAANLPTRNSKPFNTEELLQIALSLNIPKEVIQSRHPEARFQSLSGSLLNGEHLHHLTKSAHCTLYLSANDGGRIFWPYRMLPVHEMSQPYRDSCEVLAIDSSIKKKSITNKDALDTALQFNAEYVVLADVWHDVEETVEKILCGLELAKSHPYDGEIILPLQPPHDDCYKQLMDQGVDQDHLFALGGMKDSTGHEKIESARNLRDVTGEDAHIHGLGYGVTDKLAAALDANPSLLDSIDSSTPVQSNISTDRANGDERLSVVAAHAGAKLIEDVRKLSSLTETQPTPTTLNSFK
jgi:hypothetical protein